MPKQRRTARPAWRRIVRWFGIAQRAASEAAGGGNLDLVLTSETDRECLGQTRSGMNAKHSKRRKRTYDELAGGEQRSAPDSFGDEAHGPDTLRGGEDTGPDSFGGESDGPDTLRGGEDRGLDSFGGPSHWPEGD
jgi:hypothetical protein